MAHIRELTKPPIIEAMLDIRTIGGRDLGLETLASFHDLVREDYPRRRVKRAIRATLSASGSQVDSDVENRLEGYLFDAEDRTQTVQARLNGFTYNRLAPYPGWKAFSEEGLRLWQHYKAHCNPAKVSRIALRYIDRIPVPNDVDLDDWFTTGIRIGSTLPNQIGDFFVGMQLIDEERNLLANISQRIVGDPDDPKKTHILFDTDAYRSIDADPSAVDVQEILTELRQFKNELFFGSLTDRCLEALH